MDKVRAFLADVDVIVDSFDDADENRAIDSIDR